MSPGAVRGVLFDVDGTLVDSVDAHTRAWIAAFAEAGHEARYERVRGLIGMGGDSVLPVAIGVDAASPEGKRIAARRRDIFLSRELQRVQPTRGAAPLIAALRASDAIIGLASSAQADELRPLLALLGAEDLVEAAASADDVARSKPHPDVIRVALRNRHLRPEETVLIGDTAYDIRAAASAGVATIALRSGGWLDDDLAEAIAIYDDPADVLAHAGRSPLATLLGNARAPTAAAT